MFGKIFKLVNLIKIDMNIFFDNIIFSLQKAGGVSNVWKELISIALANEEISCNFIEFKNFDKNIFRKNLTIDQEYILKDTSPLILNRYIPQKIKTNTKFIFHSSYYRICKNKCASNVTTVHDFIYEYYRKGLPKFIHHQQKRIAVTNSDALICVSNNTKNDLLNFFPSISEDRVFVIHNGVSSDFNLLKNKEKPSLVQNLGKYALYIGDRVQPHKNFRPIVDAISRYSELKLVLVGGGEITESEFIVFNKNIKNRYFHFSSIDNITLNILYNYAHVLIYPSEYEGFGIPIIEAQRAGCPVIAKKGSSITEVAQDSALLMDTGDSEEISHNILELEESKTRNKLINKGLINSQRFSWDKMAEKVFNVYKSLQ